MEQEAKQAVSLEEELKKTTWEPNKENDECKEKEWSETNEWARRSVSVCLSSSAVKGFQSARNSKSLLLVVCQLLCLCQLARISLCYWVVNISSLSSSWFSIHSFTVWISFFLSFPTFIWYFCVCLFCLCTVSVHVFLFCDFCRGSLAPLLSSSASVQVNELVFSERPSSLFLLVFLASSTLLLLFYRSFSSFVSSSDLLAHLQLFRDLLFIPFNLPGKIQWVQWSHNIYTCKRSTGNNSSRWSQNPQLGNHLVISQNFPAVSGEDEGKVKKGRASRRERGRGDGRGGRNHGKEQKLLS